jgi:hypothetical protein
MDRDAYNALLQNELDEAVARLIGDAPQLARHKTRLRTALTAFQQRTATHTRAFELLNLKTAEELAAEWNVSVRRAVAIISHRHDRFGIGRKFGRTWVLSAEERESIRIDTSRRPGMLRIDITTITPDDDTQYLVGPEGRLVWVQPGIGEPHIIAARNEAERERATAYIGALLNMGLVPYGMPLNQRVNWAMFGGLPTRDCRWARWSDAPLPVGEEGDTLPTKAGVVHE